MFIQYWIVKYIIINPVTMHYSHKWTWWAWLSFHVPQQLGDTQFSSGIFEYEHDYFVFITYSSYFLTYSRVFQYSLQLLPIPVLWRRWAKTQVSWRNSFIIMLMRIHQPQATKPPSHSLSIYQCDVKDRDLYLGEEVRA